MGYLLCLVVLSGLISTGTCIKCYNCLSTLTKDCTNPTEKLQPQECSATLINKLGSQAKDYAQSLGAILGMDIDKNTPHLEQNMACQKVVSMVNNEEVIVRTCQIKGSANTDPCQVLGQKNNAVSFCSLCDGDGCNSGHWMAPLSFAAILVPAFVLRAMF